MAFKILFESNKRQMDVQKNKFPQHRLQFCFLKFHHNFIAFILHTQSHYCLLPLTQFLNLHYSSHRFTITVLPGSRVLQVLNLMDSEPLTCSFFAVCDAVTRSFIHFCTIAMLRPCPAVGSYYSFYCTLLAYWGFPAISASSPQDGGLTATYQSQCFSNLDLSSWNPIRTCNCH